MEPEGSIQAAEGQNKSRLLQNCIVNEPQQQLECQNILKGTILSWVKPTAV